MQRIALAIVAPWIVAAADPVANVTATFTPSDAVFPNPERGFYTAADTDLARMRPAALADAYAEGYRLIYARIDLSEYRARQLRSDYLARLERGFAEARQAGVKLIIRAVYNYPEGETEYHDAKDAPLALVQRHIAQLAPLLHDNRDVIAVVQAGFIGAWGEWHTSSNDLAAEAPRTAIKDALLAAVPADRAVQFRYPPYIRQWVAQLPDRNSALATGFRIGFHNDCFLASQTDVGTFSEDQGERAVEQAFINRLGDIAPFGGETCNPADDLGATPRTACADILREGARYNLVYLNSGYYRPMFHDRWKAGGCIEEVSRRMGYRLRLLKVTHATRAVGGGRIAVAVTMRNDGWAAPINPRTLELILRHRATGAITRLALADFDIRSVTPGADRALSLSATVPNDLPHGDYQSLLALPDASTRLRNDPRYAIRFANADDPAQSWDDLIGAFSLGTKITVD